MEIENKPSLKLEGEVENSKVRGLKRLLLGAGLAVVLAATSGCYTTFSSYDGYGGGYGYYDRGFYSGSSGSFYSGYGGYHGGGRIHHGGYGRGHHSGRHHGGGHSGGSRGGSGCR